MATSSISTWTPPGATGAQLVDYHNCLTSLKIPGRPYTEARHAALVTLIHFRRLTPAAQETFDAALLAGVGFVPNSRFTLSPRSPYGLSMTESQALKRLREEAYGRAAHAYVSSDIVKYPWALTASEFHYCYPIVRYGGQVPALTEENAVLKSAKDVATDRAWDEAKDLVGKWLLTLSAMALKGAAKSPKLTPLTIAVGLAADIAKNVLVEHLKAEQVADLQRAYECDRVRRGLCDA